MAKSTLHSRIEAWLLSAGCVRVPSRSSKYKRFDLGEKTYWLGKAGALRAGPAASTSYNIAHLIPVEVLRTPIPRVAEPIAASAHMSLTLDHLLRKSN